jgi:hypothetical protein
MVKTPILGNLDLRAHEVAASDRTLHRVVLGRGFSGHGPRGHLVLPDEGVAVIGDN